MSGRIETVSGAPRGTKCLYAIAALFLVATGCEQAPTTPDASAFIGKAVKQTTVVEVTALFEGGQHLFELSVDEVPAGWTTFQFENEAPVHHFAFMSKVPEDITLEQYHEEITLPFQNLFDVVFLNRPPTFPEIAIEFPEWFGELVPMGTAGLTAPGRTSQTTVQLEPGNYIIECYVKTPGEIFHAVDRMLAQLTVTEGSSGAPEPTSTLEMTITNGGILVDEVVRPGKHTVAVHFNEQQIHGNLVGNDVHLVRLDDGTNLGNLAAWMDWSVAGGLATPAPAEFLGGSQDLPAGETAYFTVNLKPGTYAWIAEVDDPDAKDMLKTFTVPFGRATGR